MKLSLALSAAAVLALTAATASADVPMPECVNNPACQQNSGCSMSNHMTTPGGIGVIVLGAAAVFAMRRRRQS